MMLQGDPKLYIGPDGAELQWKGGQPAMERGKANAAIIALFTDKGWCGNYLARSPEEMIGSDFQATMRDPVTLSSLNNTRDAAEKALEAAGFTDITVEVTNPYSSYRKVLCTIKDEVGELYNFSVLQTQPKSYILLDEDNLALTDEDGSPLMDI